LHCRTGFTFSITCDDRCKHRGIYIGRRSTGTRAGERLLFRPGATYVPIAGAMRPTWFTSPMGHVESRRFNANLTVDAHARTIDFLPAKVTVINPLLVSASTTSWPLRTRSFRPPSGSRR
jgi:hypothetical protein